MRLLHNLVYIKELKTEQKTSSGIIIAQSAAEKEYEVLQIGEKCKAVKVGDKIRLYDQVGKTDFNEGYLINEDKGIKVIL